MKVTVQLEYKGDRKESLGALLRRVAAIFEQSGLVPGIGASFSDGVVPGSVSAVARALKKYPELAALESSIPLVPGRPLVRRLTNIGSDLSFAFEAVLALADGVPRSLPFGTVVVHFGHPEFGEVASSMVGLLPLGGVLVGDSWWVNGRDRSLTAAYAVEGDSASKKLPPPPPGAAAVLQALGKPRKSSQFMAQPAAGPEPEPRARDWSAVEAIVDRYRSGMPGLPRRIGLPHDLPPLEEALRTISGSGPLKPALVAAFGPRGYDCRGDRGTFTLRRRTAGNYIVELSLDVGTWSRMVTAGYVIHGPGFVAKLRLPVSARAVEARQYPIGDTANWERIVANLAALVDELDRTLMPEIEAAAGPAPEWHEAGQ